MELTQEQASWLTEYENLKASNKAGEERMKELAPLILPLIPEDSEVAGSFGSFKVVKRPTYQYSAECQALEESLKEKKKEEVAKGDATVEYTPTLYFTFNKKQNIEE